MGDKDSNLEIAEIERMLATEACDGVKISDGHLCLDGSELKLARRFKARHSEFLEYQSGVDPRRSLILVKRITQSRSPTAAMECVAREYNALITLRKTVGVELAASIPAPLGMFPGTKALVMEKLPGTSLDVILKRKANRLGGVFWRGKARGVGGLIASWLKRFHGATQQLVGQHNSPLYLASLAALLKRCVQRGLDPAAAHGIQQMAERASQKLDGVATETAARHGDFIPQNVLLDGNHVALVDFENFSECDLIYEDLGTFLAYLRLQAGSPLYSRAALRDLAEGFISGYGGAASAGILGLYTLKAAVQNGSEFQAGGGIRRQARAFFFWRQMIRLSLDLLAESGKSDGENR